MKINKTILLLVTLLLPQIIFCAEEVKKGPTDVVKSFVEVLRVAREDKKETKDKDLVTPTLSFFDYEGMARDCIKNYWTKLTSAQQKKYLSLFNQMLNRHFNDLISIQAHFSPLSYKDEALSGSEAKVYTVWPRDYLDVNLVFELHKKGEKWMIFNTIRDDVSTISNFKNQMDRLLFHFGPKVFLEKIEEQLQARNRPPSG